LHTDIKIKVIPRSGKTHFLGREGEHYRVKVGALPVEGLAMKSACADFIGRPSGALLFAY